MTTKILSMICLFTQIEASSTGNTHDDDTHPPPPPVVPEGGPCRETFIVDPPSNQHVGDFLLIVRTDCTVKSVELLHKNGTAECVYETFNHGYVYYCKAPDFIGNVTFTAKVVYASSSSTFPNAVTVNIPPRKEVNLKVGDSINGRGDFAEPWAKEVKITDYNATVTPIEIKYELDVIPRQVSYVVSLTTSNGSVLWTSRKEGGEAPRGTLHLSPLNSYKLYVVSRNSHSATLQNLVFTFVSGSCRETFKVQPPSNKALYDFDVEVRGDCPIKSVEFSNETNGNPTCVYKGIISSCKLPVNFPNLTRNFSFAARVIYEAGSVSMGDIITINSSLINKN